MKDGSTMTTYTHILDLAKEAEPPADGILSRTVFQDDRIKAVVFDFGQGQELSEHTTAKQAMLFFVKGEASVGLGDDMQEAKAGTWIHMPVSSDDCFSLSATTGFPDGTTSFCVVSDN